jgi:predicted DNA-binding helix-hairpin-helix protein
MDKFLKLSLLSENMDTDDQESILKIAGNDHIDKNHPSITFARLPNGKNMPLLKSMITSVCERNCNYCAFRAGRDCQRASFQPDEMANTFLELNQKKLVEGLFLSSGITGGGPYIQNKIIDTAKILRSNRDFKGYLHLKIMPGAEKDQIKEIMKYADRISINLEAPNSYRLESLSPQKDFFGDLFHRLKMIDEIRKQGDSHFGWKNRWPSISTQFVVGPSNESDEELLTTSAFLLEKFHLSRIYFMTFNPVRNTPFEDLPKENPLRGHRLYQASYLLRDYFYKIEDFSYLQNGNLNLEKDPKLVWAENHLRETPIEINRADKEQLLRIPGIGPKKVEKIASYRRSQKITTIADLKNIGIPINRAGEFILLNGIKPIHQLRLF